MEKQNKKIRILVDAHGFGGEHQGSLTYIRGLYQALVNKFPTKYEIFPIGHHYDAMRDAFPYLPSENFLLINNASRINRLSTGFVPFINKYKIDYAHFQYTVPFVKNCKFIVTTHDVLFNDFPEEFTAWYRLARNFLFKRSLQKSEIRLTVSNYSREAIEKHYGIDRNSILVTPNAVDQTFFENNDKVEAMGYIWNKYKITKYILYVSRIETRKNHDLLLQAYKELNLADRGIHLVFVGNDTFKYEELNQAIDNLTGMSKTNFHWHKNVDNNDLLQFYRAAEIFVYPSKAEGFGIPPLEAAACQVNTLCSNATAMADFDFFGSENHFEPNDLEGLKIRLEKAFSNPPSKEHLQDVANQVKSYYSWENAATILHNAIQKETGKLGKKEKELMLEQ